MTIKVGFIGLGIMGKPMSKNLLKAGYSLVVSDRNPEAIADVIAAGAETATTPKAIAEQCDVIITMLPNSPHVKEVALGENGIIEGAKPGTVVIDMSSIAPLASREISEALKAKGIDMLDAPVSGGEPKAIDGTLSVMVGGDKAIFDKYYDLMKAMAGSVVHTGDIGAGNVTKLANQVIVALNIAAMSEALTLATKAGVNPGLVYQAIRGGLAGSTVLDAQAPMVLDRNFKPGFRIDLQLKDLANALDTSHGVGAQLPLTAALMAFLNAELRSGIEIVTEALKLEEQIHDCSLVVTGEGRLDSQSVHGKVPVGVARVAKKYRKPVIGIAGSLTHDVGVVHQLSLIHISEPTRQG